MRIHTRFHPCFKPADDIKSSSIYKVFQIKAQKQQRQITPLLELLPNDQKAILIHKRTLQNVYI